MAQLADIVRGAGAGYLAAHRLRAEQRKALSDIAGCRTAGMGCVSIACDRCDDEYQVYRSCGNRSCPQCQGEARVQWLASRRAELLPVPYVHVVFSAPPELRDLARCHPAEVYDALMRAAGQAIIDVGRVKLDAQLGCVAQLHTWAQTLAQHLHVHCVVPCGGFSADGKMWVSFAPEQLPRRALSRRFRWYVCRQLRAAVAEGALALLPRAYIDALIAKAMRRRWSVYAKPPFGGAGKLLEYLSRSMYRVAISNDRIEAYADGQVTFVWRDYRHGAVLKRSTVAAGEFLRRFLQHVPPPGFVRVRSFGFLSNRNRRRNIERARQLIGESSQPAAVNRRAPRLCPSCRAGEPPHVAHRRSAPSDQQTWLDFRPPPYGLTA